MISHYRAAAGSVIFDFVWPFARRESIFGVANYGDKNFRKEILGRRERVRPKILEIRVILAILRPLEVLKNYMPNYMPHFGDFDRSSQDQGGSGSQLPQILGRSAEFAKKWHVHFS